MEPLQDNPHPPMALILGLTGSIGSGKSFVAALLRRCQAYVICADDLARQAVAPGSEALEEISRTFGAGVLTPTGALDRAALAKAVFDDREKRLLLEQILHPRVRRRELELISEHRAHPFIVVDVPLLFESGFDEECDRTLVVVISEQERLRRLHESRGMTAAEAARRLAAQMPQEEKARRADFIIDNSGTRAQTAAQINPLLHKLFPEGLPAPVQQLPSSE